MTNTITKTTAAAASMAVIPTPKARLSATAPTTVQNHFSRKIGNTTFVVSVSFNEKTTESMDDKIMRLVASDIMQGEVANAI